MSIHEDDETAACLEISPILTATTPDRVIASLLTHGSPYVLLDCDLRRMARVLTWRRRHRRDATRSRFMSGRTRK